MRRKKNGFIFVSVLMLMILVTSIAMSVAILNRTHAQEVIEDRNKDKLYYIANAGLEMVYGALNNNQQSDGSVMSGTTLNGGKLPILMQLIRDEIKKEDYLHDNSNYSIQDGENIEIKVDGTVIGYVHLEGSLHKVEVKDESNKINSNVYYYKILSKGRLEKNESNPKNIFTMSMIIPMDYPNNPKIYTGNKEVPEN